MRRLGLQFIPHGLWQNPWDVAVLRSTSRARIRIRRYMDIQAMWMQLSRTMAERECLAFTPCFGIGLSATGNPKLIKTSKNFVPQRTADSMCVGLDTVSFQKIVRSCSWTFPVGLGRKFSLLFFHGSFRKNSLFVFAKYLWRKYETFAKVFAKTFRENSEIKRRYNNYELTFCFLLFTRKKSAKFIFCYAKT
jgi:hypothetical protein